MFKAKRPHCATKVSIINNKKTKVSPPKARISTPAMFSCKLLMKMFTNRPLVSMKYEQYLQDINYNYERCFSWWEKECLCNILLKANQIFLVSLSSALHSVYHDIIIGNLTLKHSFSTHRLISKHCVWYSGTVLILQERGNERNSFPLVEPIVVTFTFRLVKMPLHHDGLYSTFFSTSRCIPHTAG